MECSILNTFYKLKNSSLIKKIKMKTIIKITTIIAIAFTTITWSSCKKKSSEPAPSSATGTVGFHLHTDLDSIEVDVLDSVYNILGRNWSLSMAQLYISNIKLIGLDGTLHSMPDTILKIVNTEEYIIGNTPVGNYKSVSFNVGLAPSINHNPNGPSASGLVGNSSTGSILNHQEMWLGDATYPSGSNFNPTDGYIFVNLQGKIDTSTSGNGPVGNMQPFKYQIGTDAMYTAVTMPDQNYTITAGQLHIIHIVVHYNKLLTGINFVHAAPTTLNVTTVAENNVTSNPIATKIQGNIGSMFEYEIGE
jgi:hypothetical protein